MNITKSPYYIVPISEVFRMGYDPDYFAGLYNYTFPIVSYLLTFFFYKFLMIFLLNVFFILQISVDF
jgi:hypothetical protein